jgi:release factor glutamine methyltransferase
VEPTVLTLLAEGTERLHSVTDQPRREAEILLGAALGRPRSWLLSHGEIVVADATAAERYRSNLVQRATGVPVAYVLGEKEFWSLPLRVGPGVLVPRPETELLVERALSRVPAGESRRLLDLGCGSGAIALALAHERPQTQVVGIDIEPRALAFSTANAQHLGLANVEFRTGHWFAPVSGERFDLIVANPPYIADDDPRVEPAVREHEPRGALYSGPSGLEALQAIVGGAPLQLEAGGWLLLEHGDRQGAQVRALLQHAGFAEVQTQRDLAGLERCTEGRWDETPRGA